MDAYLNEDEQVERIKRWIKEYGPTVVITLAIFIVGIFGWRYYQNKKATDKAAASNYYEQLIGTTLAKDSNRIKPEAEQLIKNYSDTPYAALAGLILTKHYVSTGKMTEAKKQLNWVINNASTESLQQIARNRLAKLLIGLKKPQDALKTLQTVNDKAYTAAVEILRGDAYVAMQKIPEAKKAYKAALAILPSKSDSRSLLEMKLASLPN